MMEICEGRNIEKVYIDGTLAGVSCFDFPEYKIFSTNNLSIDFLISKSNGPPMGRNQPEKKCSTAW